MDRIAGMNYVLIGSLRKFSGGPPGTTVTADWLNGIQEEILTVIENGGGLSPDPVDNTQLLQSINTIVLDAWQASQFQVRFVRYHYNSNLSNAIAAAGIVSYAVLVIDGPCVLTGNVTVPSNVTLWFLGTGRIILGAFNLIIQGSIQASPSTQCFFENSSGKTTITGDRVVEAHVHWWYGSSVDWAGAFQDAVDAAPRIAVTGPGDYALGNETIIMPDADRTIIGYGMPRIHFTPGISLGFSQDKQYYVGLIGIEITGAQGLTVHSVVPGERFYDSFLVDHCRFIMTAGGEGIVIRESSKGVIRDCYFNGGEGIFIAETHPTIITGCIFEDNSIAIQELGGIAADPLEGAAHISNCSFKGSITAAVKSELSRHGSIKDCDFMDTELCVWLIGVNGYVIEDCAVLTSDTGLCNIRITDSGGTSSENVVVRGNSLTGGTTASISIDSLTNGLISDNMMNPVASLYGIHINNSEEVVIERNKILVGTLTNSIMAAAGCTKDTVIVRENTVVSPINSTGCRLKNNVGYLDRLVGQAVILNGNTTVVVTHGLDVTPDTCFLTPDTLGGLGTYAGFSVTTYGATTFTISSSRAVGENTEIFYDIFSRLHSLLC